MTVTKIAQREETGIGTIYRDLEALQAAGFPLYTPKVEKANRRAFIDSFRFNYPLIYEDARADPAVRLGSDPGLPDGGEQFGKGGGLIWTIRMEEGVRNGFDQLSSRPCVEGGFRGAARVRSGKNKTIHP